MAKMGKLSCNADAKQLLQHDDMELHSKHSGCAVERCHVLADDDSSSCSQYSTSQCSSTSTTTTSYTPRCSSFNTNTSQTSRQKEHQPNATASATSQLAKVRRTSQLLFGVFGVYAAYLYYGIVQEELFRFRSADGGAFRYAWFLQVMESIASIALGLVGRYFCGGRRDLPCKGILLSGISQVFSKVFCSLSLAAGLSYPVMTLAKSAKIVPVMLGQLLLGGSSYGVRDCLFAGLLVTGTVMLSLGTSDDKGSDSSSNSTMGIAFVLLSLVMDGCTGGLQKQLKRDTGDTPPSAFDFIFYTHVSMLSTALVVSLITGDLGRGLFYVQQEPAVALLVTKLCTLSVVGQCFIFYVIAHFDPMVCATITTTRKMWSVLLSIAMFHHQLSIAGYSGLALALTGLGVEVQNKVFGSGHSSTHHVSKNIRKNSVLWEDLDMDDELV